VAVSASPALFFFFLPVRLPPPPFLVGGLLPPFGKDFSPTAKRLILFPFSLFPDFSRAALLRDPPYQTPPRSFSLVSEGSSFLLPRIGFLRRTMMSYFHLIAAPLLLLGKRVEPLVFPQRPLFWFLDPLLSSKRFVSFGSFVRRTCVFPLGNCELSLSLALVLLPPLFSFLSVDMAFLELRPIFHSLQDCEFFRLAPSRPSAALCSLSLPFAWRPPHLGVRTAASYGAPRSDGALFFLPSSRRRCACAFSLFFFPDPPLVIDYLCCCCLRRPFFDD